MTRKTLSSKSLHPAASQAENLGRELSNAVVFFHESIAAHLGMSAGEWRCYVLLEEHGAITASRLAQLSGFTTGAITGIADRLERAGYLHREPNPEDRRSVILRPLRLKETSAQTAPIFDSLGRAMKRIAKRYNQRELEAIADYFRRTIRALHDETLKIR
ncbi:MAG TPA: MarR family transcriptional regulator [Silvibacterium sp.]|jgi:DNA-binding MarR family transcriptional regulator|nr:MarR family transcriptional regulator [Silvibacterium sp.]